MKGVLSIVCLVLVVLATKWVVQGNSFFLFKVFAPLYEQTRRETFEQSKAYRQGMIQEIQNMQFEYVQATPDQKVALRSIILHRVSDFPMDELPTDLRFFVETLRKEQLNVR